MILKLVDSRIYTSYARVRLRFCSKKLADKTNKMSLKTEYRGVMFPSNSILQKLPSEREGFEDLLLSLCGIWWRLSSICDQTTLADCLKSRQPEWLNELLTIAHAVLSLGKDDLSFAFICTMQIWHRSLKKS